MLISYSTYTQDCYFAMYYQILQHDGSLAKLWWEVLHNLNFFVYHTTTLTNLSLSWKTPFQHSQLSWFLHGQASQRGWWPRVTGCHNPDNNNHKTWQSQQWSWDCWKRARMWCTHVLALRCILYYLFSLSVDISSSDSELGSVVLMANEDSPMNTTRQQQTHSLRACSVWCATMTSFKIK